MDDTRTFRIDDEDDWTIPDDERMDFCMSSEDEVPFHIPRD